MQLNNATAILGNIIAISENYVENKRFLCKIFVQKNSPLIKMAYK